MAFSLLALQVLVTVGTTAGTIALIFWLLLRVRPSVLSETAGAIEPEKSIAWFTVIGGCIMSLAGLYGVLFQDVGWGGVVVALLGLGAAGFMSPSLTSVHKVTWDQESIEGPSNLFGPTLGLRRTRLSWDDISRTGTTVTGYWFVESHDGRRVYWSFLYKGHGALAAFLHAKRPDLERPVSE
ncbi:hypothetical protein [Bradyrhizobium japonicum]|uniref:hypothetical protein n=1 Tax=Bradyrhizobium japonicum TaxID=375 RepID=UPI001B89DA5F|nr:hypothetical protein [Bradyrhizobium japonicum]MBR0974042.1 hypothetical protein [Bradyrhizobium japonicum]